MRTVKFLCLGDSLTEGYSAWGQVFTPYATNLKAWLEASLPDTSVSIDVAGVSGDYVVSPYGSFLSRIRTKCSQEPVLYDWILILGGTNDLAYGRAAEEIFDGLKELYKIGLDHGANVLALTIPEAYSGGLSLEAINALTDRRRSLNRLIMDYRAARFYALDLHSLLPNHALPKEVRDEMWDDGIHLTPYGYGVMGDHIANYLVNVWPSVKEPMNLRTEVAESKQ